MKDSIRCDTKNIQHCVTETSQVQIYPIVLLVKYKTVKQLREVRDPRYLPESLSQKDARHLQVLLSSLHRLCVFLRDGINNVFRPILFKFNHPQETTGRLEADFRHLISEVVPAGSNLMLVCAQVDI